MRALSTATEDCQQEAEIYRFYKGLYCRDDLCPDRDHAQKQSQRRKRGGFFNDGANHDSSPCNRTRHEHSSCYVPSQALMHRDVMEPGQNRTHSAGMGEEQSSAVGIPVEARPAPPSPPRFSFYIDIFGYCNLRCPSCPVGNGKTTRASFTTG